MQGITKIHMKKVDKLYIYIYYIKMAVRMIVIMPHMVSWVIKTTIQIRNKINVNIYENQGSNFSDKDISSGKNIYFKK